ncbi:MAG: hypothetical protein ABFC77_13630 [Thermoguttaceae bacterium]
MHKAIRGFVALGVFAVGAFCFAAPPAKVLNNFVTELVGQKDVPSGRTVAFTNPREGWIVVAVKSPDVVTASFSKPEKMRRETIVFRQDEAKTSAEAMKYLPAGDYQLELTISSGGSAESLSVRTIPGIFYNSYCRASQLHVCNDEARDWAFLEKFVNPNINTMVVHYNSLTKGSATDAPSEEIFNEWNRRGRHWVCEVTMCLKAKNADDAYRYYLSTLAAASRCDGYLIDEFLTEPGKQENNRVNIAALTRIAARPEFAGKKIHPYIIDPTPQSASYKEISEFAMAHRSMLALEWYMKDRLPKENMWDCFDPDRYAANMEQWNAYHPGAADSMLVTLADWNVPDILSDTNPQLNSKVLLDWEMNFLANHRMFQKLPGIGFWTSSYMDEESIRWMCRLFRHYCIEGNKNLLSTDPYVLTHLVNADFDQGTEGWELQMADPGAIRAETLKNYGKIQGRMISKSTNGDHFLVTRRSEKAPNVIGQTIKNLTPGRLYTFRMYTADYDDLKTGKSKEQKHAVHIALSGAQVVPGKAIQVPYFSRKSLKFAPFNSTKKPCWLNYHWVLFKAEGDTAKLTVSDWADPQHSGGKSGQELVFNFFEVEPYFPR